MHPENTRTDSNTTAADPQSAPAGEFSASSSYANYVLLMLFVVYVFNFIDRQIMSVFIGPIQQEFDLSDTAVGLLVGFAFALLYTFAGIPIARWADRGNRRTIIALGLTVWSAMTVATGFAKSFTQLFLARVGVGLGEAAGTPPAHSLIADYFPLRRRATALAVYSSGVFVGAAFAYLGGGYLREFFEWRTAFIVVGVPGILFALMVRFTIKEPPRGYSEQRHTEAPVTTSLAETFVFLCRSKAWVNLIIGASFLSVIGYGVLMWGFEFYGRIHSMNPIEIGQWMALIVGLGGGLGTVLGGRLVDRLNQVKPSLAVAVPAYIVLLSIPVGAVVLLSDNKLLSLCCFFPFYLMLNSYIPMMYSTNQSLAKLEMRATASAILLFVINIIGAGAGPFLVGLLSDLLMATFGQQAIRYSLFIVMVVGCGGGSFFLLSARHLQRDLDRASQ